MKLLVVLVACLGCALAFPTEERIIGGSAASRDQFPYQGSMQWGLLGAFQHMCGCSLISPQTALTAAHCITEAPGIGSFRVRFGILNLDDSLAAAPAINIQRNVIHPDYQGGVNPHDVAVLILASRLSMGSSVQTIGLPVAGSVPSGSAVLSGWGSTSSSIILPQMPNTLQFVNVPIVALDQCRAALIAILGEAGPLHTNNVCTGPLTGGVSACSGDSGGPLTAGGVQIGIVSWGIMPCGSVGAPSVYGRVSAYNAWINANMVQ